MGTLLRPLVECFRTETALRSVSLNEGMRLYAADKTEVGTSCTKGDASHAYPFRTPTTWTPS